MRLAEIERWVEWGWTRISFLTLLLTLNTGAKTNAQEIPVGTWRLHLSFNSVSCVTSGGGKTYASSGTGIMVLENDNSLSGYSKLSGLTGAAITYVSFNESTGQLVVAYEDGNLDIIKGNVVTNFDRLKNSTTVTGSKRINHIGFRNSLAYLSTDYGVVVFDLNLIEVKETWRDLGPGGEQIGIAQSTFFQDSVFLATSMGVLAGDIDDNLLDFSKWKRFDTNEFAGQIHGIATANAKVYATIDSNGLYHYEDGTWVKESFLTNNIFTSVEGNDVLYLTEGSHVWKLGVDNILTEITSPFITTPQFASASTQGKILIGDRENGMLMGNGTFSNFLPNGPTHQILQRLKFHDGIMYALQAGYTPSMLASGSNGDVNKFSSGSWSSVTSPLDNLTDLDFQSTTTFVSSFGSGVQKGSIETPDVVFNEDNSTLLNTGSGVNITAIENSSAGLWVANYGATSPLHLLKTDNTWQEFSFPISTTRYPLEIIVDDYGSVWSVLNPSQGGGLFVFNKDNQKSAYLSNVNGGGGLPNRNVRSITTDRDGYVWVGTDEGVGYYASPSQVFNAGTNLIRPIFESRYLLATESVTALEVDGGNRKWMGTQNGVWLFSPTGEELVYNFTEANSPLPSNKIIDIEIEPQTGEVFIATDRGVVSFRGDATTGSDFQNVKIFPNPVTPNFNGTVGISGLAADAYVKITDVSGKLIWQTQANGGTATWNARDYNGRRASTGVYLIFSASQDGSESFVGKIAVIE